MKIIVLEDLDMIETRFHHGIRCRLAVFIQQVFFQRPCIHTYTDRTVMITGGFNNFFDAAFRTDVTRINPQACSAGLCGFNSAFVMKMNVGHDGHRAFTANFFQGT